MAPLTVVLIISLTIYIIGEVGKVKARNNYQKNLWDIITSTFNIIMLVIFAFIIIPNTFQTSFYEVFIKAYVNEGKNFAEYLILPVYLIVFSCNAYIIIKKLLLIKKEK